MSLLDSGFDAERLDRLGAKLRSDVEAGRIHGAAMKVSRRGEVIADIIEGYADKEAGRLLERDSVFLIMSATKPMTNAIALSLVEQGKLRLHTPVADVIPEFAHFGKETVNLYHLMTHTSGTAKAYPRSISWSISRSSLVTPVRFPRSAPPVNEWTTRS